MACESSDGGNIGVAGSAAAGLVVHDGGGSGGGGCSRRHEFFYKVFWFGESVVLCDRLVWDIGGWSFLLKYINHMRYC